MHSITFDRTYYTNIAMCSILRISFDLKEKINFLYYSLWFISWYHITLKLIRNTLGDNYAIYNKNGKEIKWEYIKLLYLKQIDEDLTAANKLTN